MNSDHMRKTAAVLEFCEEFLLAGSIAVTFAVLVLQVFSRYVFDLPLTWTEELARYLFVWSVFVGASQAMRYGEHIAIGMLIDRLPKPLAKFIALWMNALMALFLLVLIVKGTDLAIKVAELPSTALEISMAFVFAPLPLAAAAMLLRTLCISIRILVAGPEPIQHRSL